MGKHQGHMTKIRSTRSKNKLRRLWMITLRFVSLNTLHKKVGLGVKESVKYNCE